MGFKVLKTLPIWDNYGFEADTQDPNAVLFQASSLTEGDILTLLTTWKTADGMALTQPLKTVDLGGYVAYCGQHQLYLMHSGFSTEHLKTLLEKLDAEADFQFNSLIAFGHNFDSKTLRELADNLKSYKNKKSSDIEFITRY
jgi:adenine-specific DNA-methyltransferase